MAAVVWVREGRVPRRRWNEKREAAGVWKDQHWSQRDLLMAWMRALAGRETRMALGFGSKQPAGGVLGPEMGSRAGPRFCRPEMPIKSSWMSTAGL